MSKIILFYKYVNLSNPEEIKNWQKELCTKLKLKGRIIIAHEGINATLGGQDQEIQEYITAMNNHPLFAGIDFKESPGGADCFPKLKVKVKNEIVRLGLNPQKITTEGQGKHLTPDEVHELLSKNPQDLILIDTRNQLEWEIGRFKNAILPDTKYFREFPEYIDKNVDMLKDKQVLMYCTGGVRCERASTYVKNKGVAKEVYQIEGGIHRYIEKYPDGFFRGKNYVFDNRIATKANDDILGSCRLCKASIDDYTNCVNAECNLHYITCPECKIEYNNCCSRECQKLVKENKVRIRPSYEQELNRANQC